MSHEQDLKAPWLPPLLRFVPSSIWHEVAEPALRDWSQAAGSALRRVTVQIAHWTATVFSDAHEWLRLTGIDWRPVFPRGRSTVEVYISRQVPETLVDLVGGARDVPRAMGVIDLAGGRCWVGGVRDYRGVRRAVLEVLTGRVLLGRGSGSQRWLGIPAATAEWAVIPGRRKGVAFIGPHRLRTIHAFLLVRYADQATLASLDWAFLKPRRQEALPADGHFLVPGRFVHWFPRLRPTLALAEPASGSDLHERTRLLAYQAAEELERGLEAGDLLPEELHALFESLAKDDQWLLVSPEELVGPERLADVAHVHTWVVFGAAGQRLIEPAPRSLVQKTVLAECFAYHSEAAAAAARRLLDQIVPQRARAFLVDADLQPLVQHLLLRLALAGRIERAAPASSLTEEQVHHLQLTRQLSTDRWRHASGRPVRVLELSDAKGQRALLAVDERQLTRESVEDPFAILKGVWPGQLADFFTAARDLNLRRLFAAWLEW